MAKNGKHSNDLNSGNMHSHHLQGQEAENCSKRSRDSNLPPGGGNTGNVAAGGSSRKSHHSNGGSQPKQRTSSSAGFDRAAAAAGNPVNNTKKPTTSEMAANLVKATNLALKQFDSAVQSGSKGVKRFKTGSGEQVTSEKTP